MDKAIEANPPPPEDVVYEVPDSDIGIKVRFTRGHPFFPEYSRELVIEVSADPIAREPLYGGGDLSFASLYRDENGNYVVIDMNGYWFTFEIPTRELKISEWRWTDSPPPKEYLGVFHHSGGDLRSFLTPDERPEESPYLCKDPTHPYEKD